jgi:hypothetical protein
MYVCASASLATLTDSRPALSQAAKSTGSADQIAKFDQVIATTSLDARDVSARRTWPRGSYPRRSGPFFYRTRSLTPRSLRRPCERAAALLGGVASKYSKD